MNTSGTAESWYIGIRPEHWIVLAIASAGWVFDVYEGQLFTIFKTPALTELLGGDAKSVDWHANLALAVFMVGGAVGGLGFGILSDRLGRVRVLSWTILVYSIFSAWTFFARSVWEIDALRFLVALGTGGEWAVAAALVAETFPTRARAFASGTFHASSVLGAALASLVGMIFVSPGSWRWGFLVGLTPALLILWIRWGLREPETWERAKAKSSNLGDQQFADPGGRPTPAMGSLSELLGDPQWRFRALIGLSIASVGLGTYWGIFAWGPELAREVLGPSVPNEQRQAAGSLAYLLMNFTGGLFGLLAFAPVAARCGRKFAFIAYQFGAFLSVIVTFLGAQAYGQTLILLPIMAFFVVGMHAGYAIYLPELFPTRLRATGSSFCFNVGRLLGALMLLVRGALGAAFGLRHAVTLMSCLFLVGIVLVTFAPETKEQELIV
jgi:predicted MFS family arabinose efflux permease